MSDYDYDSFYDYDNDGQLDDYERFMKEEDEDQYYYQTYGENINSSSSYRGTNTSRSNAGEFSLGTSIIIGLIVSSCLFALFNIDIDGLGEVLSLIIWGIISLVIYFVTNLK